MEPDGDKPKINRKMLVFFIVFLIVIVALSIDFDLHYNPTEENIKIDNYCQISTKNLVGGGSINVYFITWNGSPNGASSSWAYYSLIGSTKNYTYVNSSSSYIYNNTPGVIFTNSEYNFTLNGRMIHFIPIYLYKENLTGQNLINEGLNEIKAKVPSNVYNDIKIYTTEVLISGTDSTSANLSAGNGIPAHINTVSIITGPGGAYIFNGALISPRALSNETPEKVMQNIKDPTITQAVAGLKNYIEKVE